MKNFIAILFIGFALNLASSTAIFAKSDVRNQDLEKIRSKVTEINGKTKKKIAV